MCNETELEDWDADKQPEDAQRRRVIKIASVGIAAGFGVVGLPAHANPESSAGGVKPGDLLVADDAEDGAAPLSLADLKPGKPLLAFPYDAKTKTVRNESRLNKVLLLRLDPAEMDDKTKALAADGVLGFSAICTHQACEIKTWMAKQKVLACFCHASMFDPLQAGAVSSGPAARSLPTLPLKTVDGKLVVAGPFSARPGTA